MEVPAEERSLDGIGVGARPAGRYSKGQIALAQELHGMLDLDVGALAAAGIGGVLVALGADGRDKVCHADHVIAKRLVDQGGVGEAKEHTILVLFTDLDEVVLADERLAARIDVDMRAELFALRDDRVDVFK